MNKEQEQGFFNQIEKVLHAHEDPYEFGAWEEFDANRKGKKRVAPIYAWIAAAVVLLITSFGIYQINQNNSLQRTPVLVKKVQKQARPKVEIIIGNSTAGQLKTIEVETTPLQKLEAFPLQTSSTLLVKDSVTNAVTHFSEVAVIKNTIPKVENLTAIEPVLPTINKIAQKRLKFNPVSAGAYDSLINHNHLSKTLEKNANKLTYSVVVFPSFSNEKVNFGAGMELSYAINSKFSVNSGLMYNSFNAKSDGKSLTNKSVSPSQSANLALTGIELPLGIQYQTGKGFYAIAGVSAVGLINENLEYRFLEERMVTVTEFSEGGTAEVFKVVSEERTQKSIAPLNNYMGFFNFSAGKKQAFGKMNVNIGPFVKVPFSSVSVERIKLLQGGLRLSVDF